MLCVYREGEKGDARQLKMESLITMNEWQIK